jgi:uncharacterized protein
MKIHIERGATYRVQGYAAGSVTVTRGEAQAQHILTGASLLQPDAPPLAWPVGDQAPPPLAAFEALLEHAPELVLYGSGARLRFPGAQVMRLFHALGIGFETMDTFAACRTYNVLSMEGRRVLAALLIGPPTGI